MEKPSQSHPSRKPPIEEVQQSIPHSDRKDLPRPKYQTIDRDWTSSTHEKSPQSSAESKAPQSQAGATPAMLERWKEGNMRDQPFHTIEAYNLVESDNGAAKEHPGSSLEYFDPNAETEGIKNKKEPRT